MPRPLYVAPTLLLLAGCQSPLSTLRSVWVPTPQPPTDKHALAAAATSQSHLVKRQLRTTPLADLVHPALQASRSSRAERRFLDELARSLLTEALNRGDWTQAAALMSEFHPRALSPWKSLECTVLAQSSGTDAARRVEVILTAFENARDISIRAALGECLDRSFSPLVGPVNETTLITRMRQWLAASEPRIRTNPRYDCDWDGLSSEPLILADP